MSTCHDDGVSLSQHGRDLDAIMADLAGFRAGDANWAVGRTFGLVYDGGPGVHEAAEAAARMYLHDSALNTVAMPSAARLQRDVVGWTTGLLHGDEQCAGFVTSGGTESIQCAVLAARERARTERGVTDGEIVLATSAHAAFHKSAHMFGLRTITVPVLDDWTVDLDAMADAIGDRTVMVVGSAPQYPQGVIDPIPEIAALAARVGAQMHVDACMGGFVLPFAEMLGREVPAWDFRVDGVDSISADVHKLGYAPKGTSVIVYRSRELRRYQTFVFSEWLGGMYGSPNLQGTRSTMPMATAWAVMSSLGVDGYLELTERTLATADRLRAGVAAIDGIEVLGDSSYHLVTVTASADSPVDIFGVGDIVGANGWYADRQTPPDSLHHTVSNANVPVIEEYLADLEAACVAAATTRTEDRSTTYATIE